MNEEIPVEDPATKPARRLTDADWAQIVEQYELGTKSAVDLAAEFGISRQALSERFRKNGIVKGSRAHELSQAVQKTITNAVTTATQAHVERFADKRLERLEETNSKGYESLVLAKKMMDKTLIDAIKGGLAPAAVDDDFKALRRFNLAIIENMNARRHILGADEMIDEAILPKIVVDDITAEKILEHHKNIGAADEDATVQDLADIIGDVELKI